MQIYRILISCCLLLVVGLLWATNFEPINSLQDERNAVIINNNFKRISKFIIVDIGTNISVKANSSSLSVTINVGLSDNGYVVLVQPQWETKVWMTNKNKNGFTINFEKVSSDKTLDYIVVK